MWLSWLTVEGKFIRSYWLMIERPRGAWGVAVVVVVGGGGSPLSNTLWHQHDWQILDWLWLCGCRCWFAWMPPSNLISFCAAFVWFLDFDNIPSQPSEHKPIPIFRPSKVRPKYFLSMPSWEVPMQASIFPALETFTQFHSSRNNCWNSGIGS